MEVMRNSYNILVGQSEGRKPFGRPTHFCENSSEMDIKEIEHNVWTGFK
jgi:hypothetical protein